MSSPTAASRLCTAQSTSPVRIDTQAGPALLERFADLQSRCIDPDTFDAPTLNCGRRWTTTRARAAACSIFGPTARR